MQGEAAFAAVDLGAETGRIIVGSFDGGMVRLDPIHRFANVPVRNSDGLHWDVHHVYAEILDGLRLAACSHGGRLRGVGIDSWAVDYALLDAAGRMLGTPYHYRDTRTDGIREEVDRIVPPDKLYARTGIAQLPFNTLYQLLAHRKSSDGVMKVAQTLLLIPDLLHYWLTGLRAVEYTNASTTGALAVDGDWARDILATLGLPDHLFIPPSLPGTVLGEVRSSVRDECGLGPVPVILPATHDTASAVVGVPCTRHPPGSTHAYISCGTWSLLGLELDEPIVTEHARLAGFTNEGGVAATFRFLTNIMGLWIVQECRRVWARQGVDLDYDHLTARAASTRSPGVVIDVDDPAFLHPPNMLHAIADHLRTTGQPPVADIAELTRVIFEGLALAYALSLAQAERLSGSRVEVIHLVGGGSRNGLLCQFTADACRRPVLAGPAEATALGNVLVQAIGMGIIRDLDEARAIARRSFDLTTYMPADGSDWGNQAATLRSLQSLRRPTIVRASPGRDRPEPSEKTR